MCTFSNLRNPYFANVLLFYFLLLPAHIVYIYTAISVMYDVI